MRRPSRLARTSLASGVAAWAATAAAIGGAHSLDGPGRWTNVYGGYFSLALSALSCACALFALGQKDRPRYVVAVLCASGLLFALCMAGVILVDWLGPI